MAKPTKDQLNKKIEIAKQYAALEADTLKKAQKALEIQRLELELAEEYGGTVGEILDKKIKIEEVSQKIVDLEESATDGRQAALDATIRVDGATKELLKKTLLISDAWSGGIVGAIMSSKEPLKDFHKAIKKNITAVNILGSAFSSIVEMTIKVALASDEASASLNSLTGQGRSYRGMVAGISRSNAAFGVSITDAGRAYGELFGNFTEFSSLSGQQQREFTGHAARLERLGISAGTSAQNFQDMTGAFGLSSREAKESQEDLVNLARAIGMPPQQMMEGMQESSAVLSKWGKDAPRIFAKVAIHAKKLGVSFGTLVNLGDQFDTFEGAASAVGKLNALVGGDVLNAYDMMNMSLEQRNMAVKRAVEMDGESWGSMNRMKQMAYANAAGITDMTDAHRIFGGASADSLTAAEKEAETKAKTQKNMNKALTATVSIMKKLEILLEKVFGADATGTDFATKVSEALSTAHKHIEHIRIAIGIITASAGLKILYNMLKMGQAMKAAGAAAGVAKAAGGMGMIGKLGAGLAGLVSMKGLLIAGGLAAVAGGGYMAYKHLTKPSAQSGGGGAVRKASGARASTGNAETDRLAAALTVAINNAQGHDVILKIDGNEIGRFTERYIGQKYKVR